MLGDQPFLVVNGDVLSDVDFAGLKQAASQLDGQQHLAHLLLVDNPPHHPAGDFGLLADGLLAANPTAGNGLTFSGIAAYHPALFVATPAGQPSKLAPLLRAAMAQGQVTGSRLDGLWLDVGTPERLAEADAIATGWTA